MGEASVAPVVPVAVCVVTHNCISDIEPFVAALERLRCEDLELIVVDSGSGDGTVEMLKNELPSRLPTVIETLPTNVGYAEGMNRAIELTTAEWILALNADAWPDDDFLERSMAAVAESADTANVGAVTGRLRRPSRPSQARSESGQGPTLDACGMFVTWAWRHHDRGSGRRDVGQYSIPEQVFGATGAAVLLRRRALDDVAIDGEVYATEFHSYREDAELCFRLQERGWRVLYEPTATAEHRRASTPSRRRTMPAHVNYHSLKNRYLLRAYHQGPANLAWTLLPALVRDLAALSWVLIAERSSLAAYSWLWSHRREIWAKRRRIRARRSVGQRRVDRWFWRKRAAS